MARRCRALIVVDVQNDFCEGGSLPVSGGAAVAAAITEALARHADGYSLVVATRDWHVDPGSHFAPLGARPDYVETWPVHCRAGTTGAQFHPALHLPEGTVVVDKGERSAAVSGFDGHDDGGRTLDTILRDASITDLDIAGIATSACVRATALDASARGFGTRLLLSLCADVPGADTGAAVRELCAAGVKVDA